MHHFSVAKRKSLFDDKPEEIQQLTYIIKQDIASLNKQIAQLQNISKSQASRYGKHKQGHTNSVVVGLQQKLALMSNDFKGVLEIRTEVSSTNQYLQNSLGNCYRLWLHFDCRITVL